MVNALVAEPLRYIAVERGALLSFLHEDGPLSNLLLVGELPGALTVDDKVDLVTRLISEGLLNVISAANSNGRTS